MAADVTPALLAAIQTAFERRAERDATLKRVAHRIRDGTASQEDAHDYALRLGELLSKTLAEQLTETTLPNGRLYWNIAYRTIRPMLANNHRLTNQIAAQIQRLIDEADGVGLAPVEGALPDGRIAGLIEQAASAASCDEMRAWLGEPVINCTESFFDGFVRANAEARYQAGMPPKIVRTAAAGCCAWCAALAGTYDYGDVRGGSDVFRRHQFCRCVTTWVNGRERQDVWSRKSWREDEATLTSRRQYGAALYRPTREQIQDMLRRGERDAGRTAEKRRR